MDDNDLALIKALEDAQKNIVVEDEVKPETALEQYQGMGFTNFVADYNDGQVLQNPETSERVFVSPGYITSDPAIVEGIMNSIKPSDTQKAVMQEKLIEEKPFISGLTSAVQDVPFIGSYTDDAIDLVFGKKAGDAARFANEAFKERRPGKAILGGISAGVLSSPMFLPLAPAWALNYVTNGASILRQMGRAALIGIPAGGTEGMISGFGRGEGEDRAENAKFDAVIGAGAGGIFGSIFPPAKELVSFVWKNIKGRSVKEIANKLGISYDASRVIRTALENDDIDAAQDALSRAGSSSMLADAGPATGGLLDVSVTSGGKSPRFVRKAVEERGEEAGKNINLVLNDVLGTPQGLKTTQSGIRVETAPERSSTYKTAYEQPINYSAARGQRILDRLKRVPQSAINAANKLMILEGNASSQILATVSNNGTAVFKTLPDVRQLDYITRALNQVAEQQNATGKLGGTTPEGVATGKLSQIIRNILKKEIPEYADALKVSEESIKRVQAVETGYSILDGITTRETVADSLKKMNPTELQEARQGLRSSIDDTLAKVNAVASDANVEIREFQKLANNLRSRASREKMRLLIGDEATDALYKKLDEAVVTLELRATISRNSKTQVRDSITGKVEEITAPGPLTTLLSGEPIYATKKLVQVITGTTDEARALRQMGIYDEIAGVLIGLRGKEAQNALRLIRRAVDGDVLTTQQAEKVSKILTSSAAVASYSRVTSNVDDKVVPIMDGSQINTDENYSTELDDADITNALIKSLRDLPEVSNKIINSVP
tara:strand:- start:85 stop:2427 length:2343 start_codon:yes stop_codon:yes gene_type:complete